MVETELRQILDPRLFRSTGAGGPSGGGGGGGGGGGSTPPLPALPLGDSPAGSQPGTPPPARQSVGVGGGGGGGGLSQPDLLEAMSSGGGGAGGPSVRRSGSSGQSRGWAGRVQEVPLTRDARDQRSRHRIPLNTRLGECDRQHTD